MKTFEQLKQLFFKHLRFIFDLVRGKSGKEVDDLLVEQGRDEEEKKVIREICEEVDLEHEMLTDLLQSGENQDQWLDHQIEAIVKESFPDATDDDINQVKEAVLSSLEEEIEFDTKMLEEEVDLIISAKGDNNDSFDKPQGKEDQTNE